MLKSNLLRKMVDESRDIPDVEHSPVMMQEVVESLRCRPGGTYVDGTLGLAGHALAILEKARPDGLLIGLDRDKESLERARERLKEYADSIRLVHANFKNLPLILNGLRLRSVDGILLDLGASSAQLLTPERGFSFHSDAMLDMRMDRTQPVTAADLVNSLPEEELAGIIYRYGEERLSRRIAEAIVAERRKHPITRCSQLAGIICGVVKVHAHRHIHPATRTFQALRIAVNQELGGLDEFFTQALPFLGVGARIVVSSFHSLEDRIAKIAFRRLSGQCVCDRPADLCVCPRKALARVCTPRPLTARPAEVAANPRARSARLRALERI